MYMCIHAGVSIAHVLYAQIFTHIYPKFSKQDWPTNHFQIEDIVKQPMGKRKRPFQISYMYIYIYLPIFTPNSQNKIDDKPFSNRRYCQTTNGEAEKTISNRRCSLYAHVFTHIYSKFSKQDWPTNHFQIEDIVKQPMGKRKRPFQIEDIHYTNPKFSEQDCATNHFLNRRYSVGWSTKFVLLVLV